MALVAFADDKVVSFDRNPSLRVIQCHLDDIDVGVLALVTLRIGTSGLVSALVQHPSFLLLGHGFKLVA